MAVNLELWLIFAGMVAVVVCGCIFTRPKERRQGAPSERRPH